MRVVFDALATAARTRAHSPAFRDETLSLDWASLAGRVCGLVRALDRAAPVIGLALPGGVDHVVADLAVSLSGRRLVPLPFFFSAGQLAHVVHDAGIGAVISRGPVLEGVPDDLPVIDPDAGLGGGLPRYVGGATRVIYTSGSSGRPKGVVLGDRQIGASVAALAEVVGATPDDRHLSVLPLAQLLEQIAGVFLPILAGAETVFDMGATTALFGGPIAPLVAAMTRERPTTTLLAPALLGRWVAALEATDSRAPDSLRFVAVGGASTAPDLLQKAAARGIPVHEGYGLSECCAVVAMNRPGDVMPGTVGRVLGPLSVSIEAGEIVVEGPTVMQGYLNGPTAPARWHTGDLGHFTDGRLVIEGRKDALLITGAGRNISPEWVEARVNADPRVVSSALCLTGDRLVLLVAAGSPVPVADLAAMLIDLPTYARPAAFALIDPRTPGFLFPAGTPNRRVAATLAASVKSAPIFEEAPIFQDTLS